MLATQGTAQFATETQEYLVLWGLFRGTMRNVYSAELMKGIDWPGYISKGSQIFLAAHL
jgi:hypothetical protein